MLTSTFQTRIIQNNKYISTTLEGVNFTLHRAKNGKWGIAEVPISEESFHDVCFKWFNSLNEVSETCIAFGDFNALLFLVYGVPPYSAQN
jgi:hypothetical protein